MPEWVQICHDCNSKKFGNGKWVPTPKTRTCTVAVERLKFGGAAMAPTCDPRCSSYCCFTL